MSHFYGRVQGGRGQATRCGHKNTGLHVSAESWQHKVHVWLHHGDDEDYVSIQIDHRTLFHGPMSQLVHQSSRKTLLDALVIEELVAA